ncbi:AsmA family protein [Terracidiphilus gabretensis]|uniref:AsmA family protein n=1 Tax=Terracidiphilus gabretensis TaxID=1577687 RepID=UPI00071C08C6|nr:AsmA family protein [Terracidiphilus gabretensis]
MTSEPKPEIEPATKPWLRRHIRLTLGLSVVILILLLVFVPPYISISRYKSHITQLVSTSLGRPVHLSAVELRMLPRPGFVITDLNVEEDPAFGAEPVLHADTVVASVRLFSLWRGHLALDRISVDQASVNLVRNADGRWNADSLLRTAEPTADTADTATRRPLPYMEATNSRINVKFGTEKIPFSLTNTDASLWREDDGWHIRLRGQPARTDIPLDQADTGIVRLEATLSPASHLSHMPLHVEMDWRKAQLGQLSLLILGSDQDWRGDLTGELHADGSADALTISTRLRATGVHRVEFEPLSLLDFDANCSFLYHFSARSLEKIECNSPIGDGRAHLTGSLPASPATPQLTLELDKIPAQAPLDILRTFRGNFNQSLSAQGSFSGKMTYALASAAVTQQPAQSKAQLHRAMGGKTLPPSSLQGSFTGQDLRLTGQGLANPISITNLILSPAPPQPNQSPSLTAAIAIPTGAPAPLAITAQLSQQGFNLAIRGSSSLPALRDLAHATGVAQDGALTQITSSANAPISLDLHVSGPWLTSTSFAAVTPNPDEGAKTLSGSIALRNAAWKPDFLSAPVDLGSATLRFENGLAIWDGVSFAYGPSASRIRGTATLAMPLPCASSEPCAPHFTVRFSVLDLTTLQQALLGAHEPGTIISSFIDRFRPPSQLAWPAAQGTVQVDSLTAGLFTFTGASARLQVESHGVKITGFEAQTLGGQIHGTASFAVPASQPVMPIYTLDASFTGINPTSLSKVLGETWTGSPINGSGTLKLSGFTPADLASSAQGTLNFDWRNGRITQQVAVQATDALSPTEFTRWTGTAKIDKSAITLGENKLQQNGSKPTQAEGSLTFAQKPKLTLITVPTNPQQ